MKAWLGNGRPLPDLTWFMLLGLHSKGHYHKNGVAKSKGTQNIAIYDINGYLKLPCTNVLKTADIGPFISWKSRIIYVMRN